MRTLAEKDPELFLDQYAAPLIIDTGLLCYLLGLTHQDNLLKTFDRGSIFENMVIMEGIKKTFS